MKWIKKLVYILVLATLCLFAPFVFSQENQDGTLVKRKVVVLSFVNLTNSQDYEYLETVFKDSILLKLQETDLFNLIEEDRWKAAAQNLQLSYDDYFEDTNAIQIGRNTEADVVVSGGFFITPEDQELRTFVHVHEVNTEELVISIMEKGQIDISIFDQIDHLALSISEKMVEALPPIAPRSIIETVIKTETVVNAIDLTIRDVWVPSAYEHTLGIRGGILNFFGKNKLFITGRETNRFEISPISYFYYRFSLPFIYPDIFLELNFSFSSLNTNYAILEQVDDEDIEMNIQGPIYILNAIYRYPVTKWFAIVPRLGGGIFLAFMSYGHSKRSENLDIVNISEEDRQLLEELDSIDHTIGVKPIINVAIELELQIYRYLWLSLDLGGVFLIDQATENYSPIIPGLSFSGGLNYHF